MGYRVAFLVFILGQLAPSLVLAGPSFRPEPRNYGMVPQPQQKCAWGSWSAWGSCSVSCGQGQSTRMRVQTPIYPNAVCTGSERQNKPCQMPACNTNPCHWRDWSAWGACSTTCGAGIAVRTRSSYARSYGALPMCFGLDKQTKPCTLRACPAPATAMACTWNTWSAWGPCSATCGAAGVQTRTRTQNPATNGGAPCVGSGKEVVSCGQPACSPDPGPVVNCQWSAWVSVGTCSKTCGGGVIRQTRTRSGTPKNGGTACVGDDSRTLLCNTHACGGHGVNPCIWREWSAWGACSTTCGAGTAVRTRSPYPNHGVICPAAEKQTKPCTLRDCRFDPKPVNCQWSAWTSVGTCSKTCGGGVIRQTRRRSGTPTNGGIPCLGNDSRTVSCNTPACPVDCVWSAWVSIGSCSKTCGAGFLTQTRTQTPARNGGLPCAGSSTRQGSCNTHPCFDPIGCVGTWSDWSVCPAACGATASQSRTFTVITPAVGGGDPCPKSPDTRQCQGLPCPVNCTWSAWADVGSCSKTCGGGSVTQTRTQTPAQNGGQPCIGNSTQSIRCNTQPCFDPISCVGSWGDWSVCTAACGATANQTRTFTVTTPAQNGGNPCPTSPDTRQCQGLPCPVDCTWSAWANVGSCSKTCGTGSLMQTRIQTPAQNGGQPCTGDATQSLPCNTQACPVDCAWSTWANVGSCSTTCGAGTLIHTRTQTPAQNGGQPCTGDATQSLACNTQACSDPISCQGAWGDWSACPAACGESASQNRTFIVNIPAQAGGESCPTSPDTRQCHGRPCPVDCKWSDWADVGSCNKTCGTGFLMQTRTQNPAQNGGQLCTGDVTQYLPCNTQPCPVDCTWSDWANVGSCNQTCGSGSLTQKRTQTPAQNGGQPCTGDDTQSLSCNTQPCLVDCTWSDWANVGSCSKTCGSGSFTQTRTQTPAQNGGQPCTGDNTQPLPCNTQPCPVDCTWSDWANVGSCSKTCGGGSLTQNRTQTPAQNGGQPCTVDDTQSIPCNTQPCLDPISCQGTWSDWSVCPAACGATASQSRTFTVTSPAQPGGEPCPTSPDTRQCQGLPCPVDCTWSDWADVGSCNKTCGTGSLTQTRTQTPAQNGGQSCTGDDTQSLPCNTQPCPVNCTWSDWANVGTCNETCGTGYLTQTRTQTPAQSGGQSCTGDDTQSVPCNTQPCPVDCTWSAYTDVGSCNQTCGTGSLTQTRTQTPAQNGGRPCTGDATQSLPCNTQACPVDCTWSAWANIGSCSKTCGSGTLMQNRTQTPAQNGGQPCTGDDTQSIPCNTQGCLDPISCQGMWGDWSACPAGCGATASQNRTFIVNVLAEAGGNPCPTSPDTRQCQGPPCPVDCTWSGWADVGSCNQTCGSGFLTQNRTQTPAQNGGQPCTGDDTQSVPCNTQPCPVDCKWSDWADVGSCNQTCGTGSLTQNRTQTPAQNGGKACTGDETQSVPCNTQPCPVDCTWSTWANVGSCSKTCGSGTLMQNRTQTPAQNGGQPCTGDDTQSIPCNTQGCQDPISCQGAWGDWSACPAACRATASQNRAFIIDIPAEAGGNPCPTSPDTRQCQGPPCPVDCTWSDWADVGSCNQTCGTGSLTQNRTQTPAQNGGLPCTGDDTQSVPCNTQPCPVDCTWSTWANVGSCSKTCGSGTLMQNRTQTPAQNGGQPCTGDDTQSIPCNTQACQDPISCQGAWGDWSPCPAACGVTASQNRTFIINIPAEAGGNPCPTSPDTRQCQGPPCPVDCTWSDWADVGSCNQTCGTGFLTQNRTQTPAQNGGQPCTIDDTQSVPCNTQPCPVDCKWSDWADVGSCNQTCGTGSLTQNRTQTSAQNGGQPCTGDDTQSVPCNTQPCPVDCKWSDWADVGSCNQTCGTGFLTQNRTQTPAQNGGQPCTGDDIQSVPCNTQPCPVDCTWSAWDNVGSCSKTCGSGTLMQNRTETPAQNGGQSCTGNSTQSIPCNTHPCPVDCTWSAWANVGSCSKTCGNGTLTQNRTQTPAQNGGQSCTGNSTQSIPCNTQPCPVDCTWSDWADVGSCNQTCGTGILTQTRTRTPAQNGGQTCTGDDTQSLPCNTQPCPVDCTWSAWANIGSCSKTCGSGTLMQNRTQTPAQNGGQPCTGNDIQSIPCNTQGCQDPISCQGAWGDWSACPAACEATASQNRTFIINIPAEAGGNPCPTSPDTRQCQGPPCPVDCTWSDWADVGSCNQTCGTGSLMQNRTQTPAQNGGQPCTGDDTQSVPCNTQPCPVDCTWSAWANVGSCSRTCGNGTLTQNRTQTPAQNGGQSCTGNSTQFIPCNTQPCPVDCTWSAWANVGSCSRTCGNGTLTQNRTQTPAQNGGQSCTGNSTQSIPCNTQPCPVDCTWSAWANVGSCSRTCGNGTLTQNRTQTPAQNGGQSCTGNSTQSIPCNTQPCPVDCMWSAWANVGSCSTTCGTGSLSQNRTQTPAQNGGQPCTGNSTQSIPCNTQPCPVDCTWSAWTDVGSCSKTCGNGTLTQNRTQTPAQNGGQSCTGNSTQSLPCNTQPCQCTYNDWSAWDHTCPNVTTNCVDGAVKQTRNRTATTTDCIGNQTVTEAVGCLCPKDCVYGLWSDWTPCNVTILKADKTCNATSGIRTRTKTDPVGSGLACTQPLTENRTCACACASRYESSTADGFAFGPNGTYFLVRVDLTWTNTTTMAQMATAIRNVCVQYGGAVPYTVYNVDVSSGSANKAGVLQDWYNRVSSEVIGGRCQTQAWMLNGNTADLNDVTCVNWGQNSLQSDGICKPTNGNGYLPGSVLCYRTDKVVTV